MNITSEVLENELDKLHIHFINDIFLADTHHTDHMDKELFKDFNAILHIIIHNLSIDDLQINKLANTYLASGLTYIIAMNHLNSIQNELTHIYLNCNKNDDIIALYKTYTTLKNRVGKAYLKRYLKQLQSQNQIRLIRLSELIEKNVLTHYEAHIIWLNSIAEALIDRDVKKFPILNSKLCSFGKWLHDDAVTLISNKSKYNSIYNLHENLHQYSSHIEGLLKSKSIKHLSCMSYLEKMEMASLEIGTELALIDNKMMIAKATKDPLTGVLNRSLLEQVFFNQYEIALATEGHFIMAMCDLDNFKLINDTYGHVCGDLVLKSFANILKKGLRSSDIIVRYGGEEFIIILPASNYELAYKILNTQRIAFQNSSIENNGMNIQATVSIGIVEITFIDDLPMDDLFNYFLEKADKNLYSAKNEGRNRVK